MMASVRCMALVHRTARLSNNRLFNHMMIYSTSMFFSHQYMAHKMFSSHTGQPVLRLNDLQPVPGSVHQKHRVGRGPGSGMGKTAKRGHKGRGKYGHKGRSWFEGGQTPLWRRTPKRGFTNRRHQKPLEELNLKKLMTWIRMRRIDASDTITMKTLQESGCLRRIRYGVKILGKGPKKLQTKINIEVTDISAHARELIEEAGGSVKLIYYGRVGLRALLHPEKFHPALLPSKDVVPPPKLRAKYNFQNMVPEEKEKQKEFFQNRPKVFFGAE